MVEQDAVNVLVAGSNPAVPAINADERPAPVRNAGMLNDRTPLWVLALKAICAQKRDYFIEAIREKEARRKASAHNADGGK